MNLLDAIELETEFITVGDERRQADQRIAQAFSQNERLVKALRDARDEIAVLRERRHGAGTHSAPRQRVREPAG